MSFNNTRPSSFTAGAWVHDRVFVCFPIIAGQRNACSQMLIGTKHLMQLLLPSGCSACAFVVTRDSKLNVVLASWVKSWQVICNAWRL